MSDPVWKQGSCDVCVLVDADASEKRVGFCGVCKKWICGKCRDNYPKRLQAALRNGLGLRKKGGGEDE